MSDAGNELGKSELLLRVMQNSSHLLRKYPCAPFVPSLHICGKPRQGTTLKCCYGHCIFLSEKKEVKAAAFGYCLLITFQEITYLTRTKKLLRKRHTGNRAALELLMFSSHQNAMDSRAGNQKPLVCLESKKGCV